LKKSLPLLEGWAQKWWTDTEGQRECGRMSYPQYWLQNWEEQGSVFVAWGMYLGLNSGLCLQSKCCTTWAALPVSFALAIFGDGFLVTVCPGWPWTSIFCISATQVDKIKAWTTSTWLTGACLTPGKMQTIHKCKQNSK
jgi:hypothetical protein